MNMNKNQKNENGKNENVEKTPSQKIIESYYHYYTGAKFYSDELERSGCSSANKTFEELLHRGQGVVMICLAMNEFQKDEIRFEELVGFCNAIYGKTPQAGYMAKIAQLHKMFHPEECENKPAYQTPEITE
jgi:hypothetical protein